MRNININYKIALSIPSVRRPNRYFSIRLKDALFTEPSEYSMPTKLLAISDIEGNFRPFSNILIKSKVVNKHFDWIYGDGHLVILGDCFDRGDQVIECLWLIYMLEEKARKDGGKVHFILGNHEIMNLNGDWRYVHPKYAKTTKSKRPLPALYDGNSELWRWLLTKNIVEKIGSILFVHGGIAAEILKFNISIEELNSRARPHYAFASQSFTDPLLQLLFNSNLSPLWYSGYYREETSPEELELILSHFKVRIIVTGHTLVNQISTFFNGRIINIDTDHTSGSLEALYVRNEIFFRIKGIGKNEKLL